MTVKTFMIWLRTNDPIFPYKTYHRCKIWRARVNDFPEQILFSILEGLSSPTTKVITEFNEWPDAWRIIGK